MSDLKPCPFCGGPADIVPDRLEPKTPDHVYVMCKACDVYAPHIDGPTIDGHDCDTRAGQEAAWNRRPSSPPPITGDALREEGRRAELDEIGREVGRRVDDCFGGPDDGTEWLAIAAGRLDAIRAAVAKERCAFTAAGGYRCTRAKHPGDDHGWSPAGEADWSTLAASPRGGAGPCDHIGPFSEGPAAEPQDRERNQLYNAGFEMGVKHATKRVVKWLRGVNKKESNNLASWIEDGAHLRSGGDAPDAATPSPPPATGGTDGLSPKEGFAKGWNEAVNEVLRTIGSIHYGAHDLAISIACERIDARVRALAPNTAGPATGERGGRTR